MYNSDQGVLEDKKEANKWIKLAANQENEGGLEMLRLNEGLGKLEEKNKKIAEEQKKKRIQIENTKKLIKKEEEETLNWMQTRANNGDVKIQFLLGVGYLEGIVYISNTQTIKININIVKGKDLLRKAALQGHQQAKEILKDL